MPVQMTRVTYKPPTQEVLERRLRAADRPGEHLWVITACWALGDPEQVTSLMDGESLLELVGPGCFKCEEPYSRKLAKQRCRGSVT